VLHLVQSYIQDNVSNTDNPEETNPDIRISKKLSKNPDSLCQIKTDMQTLFFTRGTLTLDTTGGTSDIAFTAKTARNLFN